MKSIKQRVVEFIENQGVEKLKFYKEIGVAASNFSANGLLSEIGGSKISKILLAYPSLNARWLLTGEGEMLLSDKPQMIVGSDIEPVTIAIDVLKQQNKEMKEELDGLKTDLINCMKENKQLTKAFQNQPSEKNPVN